MSHRPTANWVAVRIYARLLAVLPREFRRRFGSEMASLYADLHAAARRDGGRLGSARIWLRSVTTLLATAVEMRVEMRRDRRRPARLFSRGQGAPDDGTGGEAMNGFLRDVRHAARTVARRPGFALTVVAILASGIGATTTIFSVVDAVLLRALPYPEAGRLVHFDEGAHPYPAFREWRELSAFESVAAARDLEVDLTGEGAPERLPAAAVSDGFFRLLGAAPYMGRLFGAADYPGDGSIAVLSHAAWQRRWGGNPDILGRTIVLNGNPVEVVGILDPALRPPDLETGSRVDVWMPLDDGGEQADQHGYHVLGIMGRLATGATVSMAQAQVDASLAAFAEAFPQNYLDRDGTRAEVPLVGMHEATVREVSGPLWLLLGAVGFMLLIACANVANLFLAHGTSRSREIALRAALGASRGRIARQVLTESMLLALFGGAAGIALAYLGVEAFQRFNPGGIPRIDTLSVDSRLLGFTVAISVATGVLFGWIPALQAMHGNVQDSLKDGAASTTVSRGGRRTRNLLVVSEMALAMVLLVGAGLLFRTFATMLRVDPGFDTERLVVVPVSLDAGYDEQGRLRFTEELMERVAAIPGTRSVAGGWTVPFSFTGRSRCCWRTGVIGDPALVDEDNPFRAIVHPVTGDYFTTLGAPVTYGRDFSPAEMRAEASVAILNRVAARGLFGADNVVGRTVIVAGDALTVVGVVEGVHHWGLNQEVENGVYVPYARYGGDVERVDLLVRTDLDVEAMAGPLRAAIWAIDADLPLSPAATMDVRVSTSLATPRFFSLLIGGFAAVALVLACGGVYGTMLYTVGQRRRELGLRLALGADGIDVVGLVLRYGIGLTVAGVGIGTIAGLLLSRVIEGLLWNVEPTDPLTFVAVALVLSATAVAASLAPAWSASRTDPIEALRAD